MLPPDPRDSNITPEKTGEDACPSDDVFTATAIDPLVAAPIIKPLIVTVHAAVAPMVAPDVVITTAVSLVGPQAIFKPGTLLAPEVTTGVTEGAKKLGGYESVIEPPDESCKYVRNDKVTVTFALPETRSDGAMEKVR